MKQIVALSTEARQLIDMARAEPGPGDETWQRLERNLAPMFAAGPGSVLLEPSVDIDAPIAPGVAAHGRNLWRRLRTSASGKALLASTSVAMVAGAFWLGRATASKPSAANPDMAASPVQSSPLLPLPSPAVSEVDTTAEVPSAMRAPMPPDMPADTPPAAPSAPAVQKARGGASDIAALGEVEVALRQGNPSVALAKLDALGRPGQPRLRRLGKVLRAVALCDLGRLSEGRRLVQQLEDHPDADLFDARLTRACQRH